MPDESLRYILDRVQLRMEKVESRLDRNWVYQVVIITLGFAYVYHPPLYEQLRGMTKVIGEFPTSVIPISMPIALTYLFLKFGYLLSQFLMLRETLDRILKSYPADLRFLSTAGFFSIFGTRSIFEVVHHYRSGKVAKEDKIPFIVYFIFISIVINMNHALIVLFIDVLSKGQTSLLIPLIAFNIVVVGSCYYQFLVKMSSKRLTRWGIHHRTLFFC